MNFQGRLTNASGNPLANGTYNMKFRIMDAPTGGSVLWTEQRANSATTGVTVTNGIFSVQLGDVTALAPSLFNGAGPLYFEVELPTPATATCTGASCEVYTEGAMTPRNKLGSSAYAFNSDTLDGLDSTAFAAATGSANYIQNGSSPQTANFNVTGTGTAALLQAATFDRANAGTLTIGGTNATSITMADSATLSAGLSLTLTGGNTASRPGSPVEGMVYYDTDTKQLLTYANGKWQADRSDAVLVAASNSSAADKAAADYVADGNTAAANDGDQVQINSALTAAAGKKVVLLAGTYFADATILVPNNTTLAGVGDGTVIELYDIDVTENLIENSDTTTGTAVTIRDLKLDGRKDLNSATFQDGIALINMGTGSGAGARLGATLTGLTVQNFKYAGISLDASSNNIITANRLQGNNNTGILMGAASSSNTVTSNSVQGSSGGITISASSYNVVTGNISQGNTYGILISSAGSYNTITGNTLHDNGNATANYGVQLNAADNNTVSNNTITDTSCTTTCYAINVLNSTSDNNYLSGNVFSTTAGTAIINDAGTGTIYAGQAKTQGGLDMLYKQAASTTAFQITNAASAAMFTADTSNSRIQIGASATDSTGIALVLDNYDQAGDPTGIPGAMYYNTNTGKFRCYQGAAWADCITAPGGATLQSAYDGSGTPATITTTSGTKTMLFKAGSGFDAAALFDIQDAAGVSMFTVDTTNDRVYVGDSAPDAVGSVLVLDTKNTTGNPTGVDGAMYYNSEDKNFKCYKNGLWADCSFASLRSEWVLQEDFLDQGVATATIGTYEWTLTDTSTSTEAKVSAAADASNRDRWGIYQTTTAATAGGGNMLRLDPNGMAGTPGNMTVEFDHGPSNAAAAAGTQTTVRIGLMNGTTTSADPTDGIYFQYATTTTAGNWFRCTQNNNAVTCTDTGVARTLTLNTYQRFKFVTNAAGTSVEFFIDEASVGVNNTNLPANTRPIGPGIGMHTAAATIQAWKIDYYQIKRNLTTLR